MRIVILILLLSVAANAGTVETWQVDGKTFTNKDAAVDYMVASGKRGLLVSHTACEILTKGYKLKKCPKNSGVLANTPFEGVGKLSGAVKENE